ncbi:hypothetical protein CDD81_194 [Ophiocordyceps australis]|uniref:Zn(2)-C6 fungal-type domain-containing protein n=1 Tax=Ophiocordyceps australis TaxID=1399860 RepID=A0A2C5YGW4_9HYPO|nr:hypothetical protein CDD81_194 [Ophiocordyceps australis]
MQRFKPLCPRPDGISSSGQLHVPTPSVPIPKRTAVRIACEPCRRRKIRCDPNRPRCTQCVKTNDRCEFGAENATQALKRTCAELHEGLTNHVELHELVRNRPWNEIRDIISNLQPDNDFAATVRDVEGGNLLLELASSGHDKSARDSLDQHGLPHSAKKQRLHGEMAPTHATSRRQISSSLDHPEYTFEKAWRNTRDMYAEPNVVVRIPTDDLPISQWTLVPVDNDVLNDILRLFWTWDMIGNRLIDRTMFELDLRTRSPTGADKEKLCFCSSFLVNAILALSCFYTTNDAVYLTPGDHSTRGAAFAKEAVRLLALNNNVNSLPVAQGMALMAIYEGEFGSVPTFMDYINSYCAYYEKLHLDHELRCSDRASDERVHQAISWISWGFYVFEWKFAIPLHRRKAIRKPEFAKLWLLESCILSRQETPDYWWLAYPFRVLPQRSYKREIFAAECALTEIIEDILEFLIPLDHEESPRANPARAMDLYKRLVDWKLSLPDCIRVESTDVPAAILLDAYFDDVIITLLRPFDSFSKEQFGGINPKATSLAHTSNLMNTIWNFRSLYSVQNEFWFTHLLAVCAFRVLFDLDLGPLQVDTFAKACRALHEMSGRFRIARDSLASIRSVLTQQNIRLPACATTYLGTADSASTSVMRCTVVPVSLEKNTESTAGGRQYTISDILAMTEHDMSID